MANQVIIQRVERRKTKLNEVNLPAAIADAGEKIKREEMGWINNDGEKYILKRINKSNSSIGDE